MSIFIFKFWRFGILKKRVNYVFENHEEWVCFWYFAFMKSCYGGYPPPIPLKYAINDLIITYWRLLAESFEKVFRYERKKQKKR